MSSLLRRPHGSPAASAPGTAAAPAGTATPRSVIPAQAAPVAGAAAQAGELWAGLHLPGLDSAQVLGALATRAQRFTPRVSLEPPDGLLLEVRGSLHLFAGVQGLRQELLGECHALGLAPVLSFAPTPLAALMAARAGKSLTVLEYAQLTGQLAPLALSVLRWPPKLVERLALAGVRTLGAVLRLPRAGFARRFGAEPLAMLDGLTGRTRPVRAAFRPRERFRRRRELDCELWNHAALLAALDPLLCELEAFLRARQCGVMQLECRLLHRHADATRCVLHLAAPAAQAQDLAALIGEQLQGLKFPGAVRTLELRADTLLPRAPGAAGLWQPGEHGGGAGRETCGLIERLRARLGEQAVHGLAVLEGHRPESAWAITAPPPAAPARAAAGECADAAGHTGRRPLWLLPVPQRLAVQDGLPQREGVLRLVSEPERIETGWWDGREIARDYYTALDAAGVRLWVFRERAAPHDWFLHGIFG